MRLIVALLVLASYCLYQAKALPRKQRVLPPLICADGQRPVCKCDDSDDAENCFDDDLDAWPPRRSDVNCDKGADVTYRCEDDTEPERLNIIACEDGGVVTACECDDSGENCLGDLPRAFTRPSNTTDDDVKRFTRDMKRLYKSKNNVCDPMEFNVNCGDGEEPMLNVVLPRPSCGRKKPALCTCRRSGEDCFSEDPLEPPACLPFEWELSCENEADEPRRPFSKPPRSNKNRN